MQPISVSIVGHQKLPMQGPGCSTKPFSKPKLQLVAGISHCISWNKIGIWSWFVDVRKSSVDVNNSIIDINKWYPNTCMKNSVNFNKWFTDINNWIIDNNYPQLSPISPLAICWYQLFQRFVDIRKWIVGINKLFVHVNKSVWIVDIDKWFVDINDLCWFIDSNNSMDSLISNINCW